MHISELILNLETAYKHKMIKKVDEKHQHQQQQAGFETRSDWNQSVASNNTQTEMLAANNTNTEANALKDKELFTRVNFLNKKPKKKLPEKPIKKIPRILLNDELDNYSKIITKNSANIETLLSSKSTSDLKSNSNNLVANNITDTNHLSNSNSITVEAHPGTPSNSIDSGTMKSKALKQRSFIMDDFERPSPDAHAELNTAFIETDVKNLKDNDNNSIDSDDNSTTNPANNSSINNIEKIRKLVEADGKLNLKLDHFKFNSSSTGSNKIQHSTPNNQMTPSNPTAPTITNKKSILTIQNQNSLANTTITNDTTKTSLNQPSRHKVLRNKVFTNGSDSNSNNSSNETEATLYMQQQQAINAALNSTKLTYLKRYVANGLANKNSLQFTDGYWNRIPGNKLKTTTIRTSSTNTGGNSSAGNPKYQSLSKTSNINIQQLQNRELSIIDLQLPIKRANSGNTQLMSLPNAMSSTKKSLTFNNVLTKHYPTNDYYTLGSADSVEVKTSSSAPKIILTTILKPTQMSNSLNGLTSSNHDYQEIGQHQNSSHVINFNLSEASFGNGEDFKHKNYYKYVMSQQKKKQQLNASDLSGAMANGTAKRQIQLVNHEVPIHSNLNNLSSNALLIRRLKF